LSTIGQRERIRNSYIDTNGFSGVRSRGRVVDLTIDGDIPSVGATYDRGAQKSAWQGPRYVCFDEPHLGDSKMSAVRSDPHFVSLDAE
jgi:hypothetical protein